MEIYIAIALELQELGLDLRQHDTLGHIYTSFTYYTLAEFAYRVDFIETTINVSTHKRLSRSKYISSKTSFDIADPSFTVQKIIDFINEKRQEMEKLESWELKL